MTKFSDNYDVIVCGGGPSGISAAVSSARQGAKTALIERYGILGGMLTSGYVNPILGAISEGTVYEEMLSLLNAVKNKTRIGYEIGIDSEKAKYILLKYVSDAGVDIFLQTPVVDVIKEKNTVNGVIIGTQNGLKELRAKAVVDATGDGFVASIAGAECAIGRDDGRCQPATTEFTIENVDESTAILCTGGSDPVKLPDGTGYSDFCKLKNREGELPENVNIVRLHRTFNPGERSVNATQVNGVNTLTPEGVCEAELELRSQIDVIISFLRKYVPGYENCRLKATGSTLGVRESRRVIGDYILNDNDVETGTRKEDVAVHKAWFLIDIHNPNGGGQAEGRSQPSIPYDIPYRCFLPKGIDGLLTCGRCISGTHRAHASYRVMGICIATGQAAGTAAALSSNNGVTPRELDVKQLQKALTDAGVQLFD